MSNKRAKWIIPPLLLVSTIAIISNIGLADFTSVDTQQAIRGEVVTNDQNFNIGASGTGSGIRIATGSDAGNPCGCTSQATAADITINPIVRINQINRGDIVYKMVLVKATTATGTWAITVYKDGNSVGPTVYITDQNGSTNKQVTILASLASHGSTLSTDFVFEVNIQKVA